MAKSGSESLRVISVEEMTGADGTVPGFWAPASPHQSVTLRAADGDCSAYVFRPDGDGPWPAALFLMDGFGMRPNIMEMAQRLAQAGYLVLLPDLFYRRGPYEPLDVRQAFAGGRMLETVRAHLGDSPSVAMVVSDAPAFLDFLSNHPDVANGSIGVTGYCMSGGMALALAGTFPDRVAAAACFHGGLLVSSADDSPHRAVPAIKAEVYVGGAEVDQWCPPEMVAQLDQALAEGGISRRCEIYEGTMHGWTMRDSPLYNEKAAERHWRELFALLDRTYRRRDSQAGS